MSPKPGELCLLCGIEIATGACGHMVVKDGQVILSEDRWESWCTELTAGRNASAALEDLQREQTDLISATEAHAYDEAYGKARAHMMSQLADDEFIETTARIWYELSEVGRVWADAPPGMRLQWINHTRPRLRALASLLRSTETLG